MPRTPGPTDAPQPSERTDENREHVENAAANRDALEEQNRRVEASVPDGVETTGPDRASPG